MNKKTLLLLALFLLILLACGLLPSAPPTTDLLATLRASTPLAQTQLAGQTTPLPVASLPSLSTVIPGTQPAIPTAIPNATGGPAGRIVYTCQIFKVQASNQICIMNADGTGFRRLTTDDKHQHVYGSPSPDGKSIVYAAFRESNVYEIYELSLADGSVKQLTDRIGVTNAPEISPDGQRIVFHNWIPATDHDELWIMGRAGKNPHRLINMAAWDPTWSPDGSRILFASNQGGTNQLWTINLDGSDPQKISNLPALRGRSDWSPDGQQIVTYSGAPWDHEVFLMNADGSNSRQISPSGGNSQGAAFSPDGQWVAFTAYFDHFGDDHGCEIYIMRLDGSDLRRLTDNDYCDYQPRWGL